jgi:hypothetical protein
MTQSEVDRIQELGDKMDDAAERAGRTWTDTADLTTAELAEWHRLADKATNEGIGEAPADGNWGVDERAGADDGRIGIQSDAAW